MKMEDKLKAYFCPHCAYNIREVYKEVYNQGKEAGRREVLEEFFKYIEYLEGYKLDDYEELWSSLGCRKRMIIKALTSAPQTPQASSLATDQKITADKTGSGGNQSKGCGFRGPTLWCGYDGLCDECKQ